MVVDTNEEFPDRARRSNVSKDPRVNHVQENISSLREGWRVDPKNGRGRVEEQVEVDLKVCLASDR